MYSFKSIFPAHGLSFAIDITGILYVSGYVSTSFALFSIPSFLVPYSSMW